MQVHRFERVDEYRSLADPFLRTEPARNQLPIAIAHTLTTSPSTYPEHRLWVVEDDGVTVAAAVRTPPHNVALADPEPDRAPEALEALVEAIVEHDRDAPGVVANRPWSAWFADRWTARTGEPWRTSVAQGVYELSDLRSPRPSPGSARRAGPDDEPLVSRWFDAFADEALPTELAERSRQLRRLEAQLDPERDDQGIWLWAVDGRPTSMTGITVIPVGARIGPVFTPVEERGRGFASNVVAHASAWHLHRGAGACFLYTDLANPTSNKVYTDLGYRRICESDNIEFRRS